MPNEPTAKKPVTVLDLLARKSRGERIVALTAYDFPSARLADEAGVDLILVGDSLAMTVLGYQTTIPVTVEEMLHHVKAVTRAQPKALVVADLPFLSYHADPDDAVRTAGRMLKEGGATAVKLEGGARMAPLIDRLAGAGIPVMGHVGMTPQAVHGLGGFRLQARDAESARALLSDARAVEAAGAFAIVLELIPAEVGAGVSKELRIPTIGIGAGVGCDGEVQIWHDLLGLFDGFVPRHTTRYADLGAATREALSRYVADVRERRFPADANAFHRPELEDSETWKS